MKFPAKGALGLAILMALSCGNNPQLVFPGVNRTARVYGTVEPGVAGTRAYLLDAEVIDSATVNSNTSSFMFDSVPYGEYLIRIVAPGFGTQQKNVFVNSPSQFAGTFYLQTFPALVSWVYPPDSTTFDSTIVTFTGDTSVSIHLTFDEQMDTLSVTRAITTVPAIPRPAFSWYSYSTEHDLYIRLPIEELFAHPKTSITIDTSARTLQGKLLDSPLRLTYFADTTELRRAIAATFVRRFMLSSNSTNTDATRSLQANFWHDMNAATVEKAFHMSPALAPNFTWSDNTSLSISFALPLKSGTRYAVTFDSGMATTDSKVLAYPVTFTFITPQMSITQYYPLNGRDGFPVDSPFVYYLNFAVDSISMSNSFSLTPAADSTWFEYQNGYSRVIVHHSVLAPHTVYSIVLDSSLTSRGGSSYGRPLRQTFTTAAAPVDSSGHLAYDLVSTTDPADSTTPLSSESYFEIDFKQNMDQASVESRITLSPPTLFSFMWPYTSMQTVRIVPLQPLKTNSRYSVALDSGYQDLQHRYYGRSKEFPFKTRPLALSYYYPLNGQVDVPRTTPIIFRFSDIPDTTDFLSHCSIAPALDSLVESPPTGASPDWSYHDVECIINHAAFRADTTYTITLDSTMADQFGVPMGRSYVIQFSTGR
jgi:hypothetical protein